MSSLVQGLHSKNKQENPYADTINLNYKFLWKITALHLR